MTLVSRVVFVACSICREASTFGWSLDVSEIFL